MLFAIDTTCQTCPKKCGKIFQFHIVDRFYPSKLIISPLTYLMLYFKIENNLLHNVLSKYSPFIPIGGQSYFSSNHVIFTPQSNAILQRFLNQINLIKKTSWNYRNFDRLKALLRIRTSPHFLSFHKELLVLRCHTCNMMLHLWQSFSWIKKTGEQKFPYFEPSHILIYF